jgi:hypothetical protein
MLIEHRIEIEGAPTQIFLGGNQEDRFGEKLRAAFNTTGGKAVLTMNGLLSEDIGVHSVRKGASTYISSGTTAAPSHNSVMRRGGWTHPGSSERYFHEAADGDEYCGRVACGLPVLSPDFGLLPPHFPLGEITDDDLKKVFPFFAAFETLRGVLVLTLASVVYHREFLHCILPKNHRLFVAPLFTDPGLMDRFSSKILTGMTSPHMRATGLPPHTLIIQRLTGVKISMDNLPPALVTQLEAVLERNGAAAANLTPQGVYSNVREAVAQAIREFGPNFNQKALPPPPIPLPNYTYHMWGGKMHRLPAGFKLPDVPVATAFRLWYQGNPVERLPPYRMFEPTDFSDRNQRKRFSDWKYMMKTIVELLANDNLVGDCTHLNMELLNTQFALAMERMPEIIKKKRIRPEEWVLVTAVRETRKAFKRRRVIVEHPEDAEDDEVFEDQAQEENLDEA